jgi:membrane associated rhomboid family serine protease
MCWSIGQCYGYCSSYGYLIANYTISLIFIGPVKLKWLVTFILVIDFLGIAVGPNAGGEIAHLGGALFGFIYIKQLQKGHDWIGGIAKAI